MKSNPKSVSPIDQFVGTRIRIRRLMVGRSQDALAESIGVTFQQVQEYEKGTNRIGIARLTQIAMALDTTVDFFMFGALGTIPVGTDNADADKHQRLAEILSFKGGMRLVEGFLRIEDEDTRRLVVDLVECLSRKTVSVGAE
jgi:transcriptional regulator with XRE-family HTH domain